MTIVERNNKLKHFIACLKCEASGKCCDDNCSTQYDAGNMGEIIENLEAISKALEQESVLDKIRAEIKAKVEEEEFARSVFRHEEKDTAKAEQCTGSIMAYNNVIKLIDKYRAESEG